MNTHTRSIRNYNDDKMHHLRDHFVILIELLTKNEDKVDIRKIDQNRI